MIRDQACIFDDALNVQVATIALERHFLNLTRRQRSLQVRTRSLRDSLQEAHGGRYLFHKNQDSLAGATRALHEHLPPQSASVEEVHGGKKCYVGTMTIFDPHCWKEFHH